MRRKNEATAEAGMRSFHHDLPATTPQAELDALIDRLNADPAVHGILVQSPLPGDLDEERAFSRIDPAKDVDGFHPQNVGLLALGRPGLRSCTPAGVMELLARYDVPLVGTEAVVIGRSNIVGKPLALLLLAAHCTVTVLPLAHARPGRAHAPRRPARGGHRPARASSRPTWSSRARRSSTSASTAPTTASAGDVDFGPVSEVAGAITPVPGGVGPMTIAMLLANTLEAARQIHRR